MSATAETLVGPAPAARRGSPDRAPPRSAPTSRAYVEQVHDIDRRGRRPPARRSTLALRAWPSAPRAQAAREAHRRLRARRARLPDPRGPPPPALHALPRPGGLRQDRDRRRLDDRARDRPAHRDLERVLPLLLRREGRGAAGRSSSAPRSGSRWRWRPRGSSSGCVFATPIAHALEARRRPVARARRVRRALGADELRAADLALPGRGALDAFVHREPRERADHRRRDGAPRRRPRTRARPAPSSATSSGRSASTSSCSSTGATSSGSSSPATCFGR